MKNAALDMLRKERRETVLEAAVWEPAVPTDEGEFRALVAVIREMPERFAISRTLILSNSIVFIKSIMASPIHILVNRLRFVLFCVDFSSDKKFMTDSSR